MTTVEPVPAEKTLSLDEKLNVQYCVATWVRDEQIKVNTAKVKGRIQPQYELRSEPIALVNFGPSLNDTWEKIRNFKFVMTCSGAHKFCVERGIIPTFHLDVDPREHKVGLIGTPQKGTEYLIASTCSPKLFDLLTQAGCDVKLWHIFDTNEDGMRLLPHGEWAIVGGCSVGVRTLTLARFLGFTDLHVFGMDGCLRDGSTHAADHPNSKKTFYRLDYDGVQYRTCPAMLEAAKNTWHELDMMKDVRATFYGEGLVQHMARNYVRKRHDKPTFIGFNKPELISSEYRELNRKLHADNLAYGVGGGRHAETVLKLANIIAKKTKFVSVLDYGCGRGYLAKALPFPIAEYDPAIPGKDESPKPADLLVCTDVLEHIEPEKLDFVLDDIRRCTKQIAFLVIYTEPSTKLLADGRNSHLIIEGESFWKSRLGKFFVVPEKGLQSKPPLLYATLSPKPAPQMTATIIQ
jgi:hypothetical protein